MKPESSIFPSNTPVPIAATNSKNVNGSLDFILVPDHVNRLYECVSNL